jgi:hypothetical protein
MSAVIHSASRYASVDSFFFPIGLPLPTIRQHFNLIQIYVLIFFRSRLKFLLCHKLFDLREQCGCARRVFTGSDADCDSTTHWIDHQTVHGGRDPSAAARELPPLLKRVRTTAQD